MFSGIVKIVFCLSISVGVALAFASFSPILGIFSGLVMLSYFF